MNLTETQYNKPHSITPIKINQIPKKIHHFDSTLIVNLTRLNCSLKHCYASVNGKEPKAYYTLIRTVEDLETKTVNPNEHYIKIRFNLENALESYLQTLLNVEDPPSNISEN